jgi:glycosyltransferase involved in cell wall biosynthesis
VVGLAYRSAPLIISDIPSHRELAEEGAGPVLFRSGDAKELAEQIHAVLHDKDVRETALQRAEVFVRKHSWEGIARMTFDVYRRAIGRP